MSQLDKVMLIGRLEKTLSLLKPGAMYQQIFPLQPTLPGGKIRMK